MRTTVAPQLVLGFGSVEALHFDGVWVSQVSTVLAGMGDWFAPGKHFDPDCVTAFLNAWDDVMDIRIRYQEDPLSIIGSL